MNRKLEKLDFDFLLRYLDKNVKSLENAVIAISGASGFVGSWLVESLIKLDSEFRLGLNLLLLTRNTQNLNYVLEGKKATNIEICEVDISKHMPDIPDFTHVIHAASPTTSTGTLESEVNRVNREGLKNLIKAKKDKRNPARLINCSSGAVYGRQYLTNESLNQRNKTIIPSTIRNFEDEYMKAKIDSESLVEEYTSLGFILGANLRLFAFYGPLLPLDGKYAIGNFMHSASRGDTILVKSSGESVRTYQYASHMAAQILYVLASSSTGNLNIGSSFAKPVWWWAKLLGEMFGSEVKVTKEIEETPTYYVPEIDDEIPVIEEDSEIRERLFREWYTWIRQQQEPK